MRRGATLLVSLCSAAFGQAQVAGKVLDDASSAPLAGATVVAVELRRSFGPGGPSIFRAVTEADGSYRFGSLAPGSYRLCVYHAAAYLDPCQWSEPAAVQVGAGTRALDIRLRRGVRLSVRVADPQNWVSESGKRAPDPSAVAAAVVSARLMDAAGKSRVLPLVRRSDGIYEYSEVIPPDTGFSLTVSSAGFLLDDDKGAPIDPKGRSFPVRLSLPPKPTPSGLPALRLPFTSARPQPAVIAVKVRGLADQPR
jgi:hypothetical protein